MGSPRLVILTIKAPPTLRNFPFPSVIPPWTAMFEPSLILNPEVSPQHTALSWPSTLTGLLTHHLPLSLSLGNQPGAAYQLDKKEASVIQLLFQDWRQSGESFSFFPESVKKLWPHTTSTNVLFLWQQHTHPGHYRSKNVNFKTSVTKNLAWKDHCCSW